MEMTLPEPGSKVSGHGPERTVFAASAPATSLLSLSGPVRNLPLVLHHNAAATWIRLLRTFCLLPLHITVNGQKSSPFLTRHRFGHGASSPHYHMAKGFASPSVPVASCSHFCSVPAYIALSFTPPAARHEIAIAYSRSAQLTPGQYRPVQHVVLCACAGVIFFRITYLLPDTGRSSAQLHGVHHPDL